MHVAKNQAASAAKRRRWKSKTLKLVRRLHLYAGLLLMPWVLLFGVSGLFFNHPNWASSREIVHHAEAEAVQATTGFVALDGEQLARRIVARLNDGSGGRFSVAEEATARLTGRFSVKIPGAGALHTVRINLADGSALIETAAEAPVPEPPPFAGQPVHIDAPALAAVGDRSVELLAAAGLEATGPARIRARPAPVLQFELRDEDGRGWHATYDLIKGTLDGRRADAGTGFSFREAVTRLHQLKIYPDQIGARWLWTLLADATAFTLIFWAVSGLIMWLQIRPTRLIGVAGLSITAGVAWLVIAGTLGEIGFGRPAHQHRGPGTSPAMDRGGPRPGDRRGIQAPEAPTRRGERGRRTDGAASSPPKRRQPEVNSSPSP